MNHMNRTEQDFDPFERKKDAAAQEPQQQQPQEQQQPQSSEQLPQPSEPQQQKVEKQSEPPVRESRFVTFSLYVRTLDMLRTVQAVIQLRQRRKVAINDLIFRFVEKGIRDEHPSAWDIIEETREQRSDTE
jgi:hypothetical protein